MTSHEVVWLLRRVPRRAGHAAPPAAGIHATTPWIDTIATDAWTWTHGHGRLRPQQPLTLSRDFLSTLVTARSVVLSFLPEFRRVV